MGKRLDIAREFGDPEYTAKITDESNELADKQNAAREREAASLNYEIDSSAVQAEKAAEIVKEQLKQAAITDAWTKLAMESLKRDKKSRLAGSISGYLAKMQRALANPSGNYIYESGGAKSPEHGIYQETFGEGAAYLLPLAAKEYSATELAKDFGKAELLEMIDSARNYIKYNDPERAPALTEELNDLRWEVNALPE